LLGAWNGCAGENGGRIALTGGFTPAEVLAAWREGCGRRKGVPASTGGPSHLGALHAVYPDIPLCPTGGVSSSNNARLLQGRRGDRRRWQTMSSIRRRWRPATAGQSFAHARKFSGNRGRGTV
jgi:hypothetical protein